jgi:deoxycytidylate deaminase
MATKDSGIVNIHGKEYQTVAKRVQDFRVKHADYSLITELVDRTDDDVVMRAAIKDAEGRVIATGYAEEKRTSSQINRTSALENAETSAIGRALAAFGMGGTEYASADEVANAIHQQSQPAPKPAPKKEPVDDALSRAKLEIFNELEAQGYGTELSKKSFITKVISQSKVETIEQAHEVMDALDNQKEEPA